MSQQKITPEDVEVNILYMLTQTFDLILRDIEWRMNARSMKEEGCQTQFRHDKKKQFNEYLDTIRTAIQYIHKSEDLNEKITQDIYASSSKNGYKTVPIWQREANELARLVLLYADRSADEDAVNKIHSYIRSLPGEGIITEEVLSNFYLKKP